MQHPEVFILFVLETLQVRISWGMPAMSCGTIDVRCVMRRTKMKRLEYPVEARARPQPTHKTTSSGTNMTGAHKIASVHMSNHQRCFKHPPTLIKHLPRLNQSAILTPRNFLELTNSSTNVTGAHQIASAHMGIHQRCFKHPPTLNGSVVWPSAISRGPPRRSF